MGNAYGILHQLIQGLPRLRMLRDLKFLTFFFLQETEILFVSNQSLARQISTILIIALYVLKVLWKFEIPTYSIRFLMIDRLFGILRRIGNISAMSLKSQFDYSIELTQKSTIIFKKTDLWTT